MRTPTRVGNIHSQARDSNLTGLTDDRDIVGLQDSGMLVEGTVSVGGWSELPFENGWATSLSEAEEEGDADGIKHVARDENERLRWWADDESLYKIMRMHFPSLKRQWRQHWRRHGWYHVHPSRQACWLCSSDAHSSSSPLSAAESAVSRFPPEIVHRIVMLSYEVYYRDVGLDDKRPHRPAVPALVCRHWANVCLRYREELRYLDKVRGKEDLMALRTLASAPGSFLKYNVTHFDSITYHLGRHVFTRQIEDPWLHLLPPTFRLLPNYSTDAYDHQTITIHGPLSKGLKTMRSIHTYLPSSVPPSFSCGIQELSLTSINFRQFADLQHVLDELPHLKIFSGKRLSWPPGVLPMTRVPLHRRRAVQRERVTLHDCTSYCEGIVLLTFSHYERSWPLAVRALAEAFMPPELDGHVIVSMVPRQSQQQVYKNGELDQHPDRILCGINCDLHTPEPNKREYQLRAVLPLAALPPAAYALDCEQLIHLNISLALDSLDWKALDQAVTTYLPGPGLLVFDRLWSSRRVLTEEDEQHINERLPLLSAAGRISVMIPPRVEDRVTSDENAGEK